VPSGTITKYQLYTSDGFILQDNIPTTNCSGGTCNFIEPGLATNSLFSRKVKACNGYGCSPFSNTASAYTSIQPVISVSCTSIGETTIQVTAYSVDRNGFSGLSLGSSGIRFQRDSLPPTSFLKSQSCLFGNLTPDTEYTFTAGPAVNIIGEGSGIAQITCSTIPTTPVPDPPANLHHTGNTVDTISWAWDASTEADYYNVYSEIWNFWGATDSFMLKAPTTNLTATQNEYFYTYTVNKWLPLWANTQYEFAVSACSDVSGCSGLSTATAVTSMPTPTDITCSDIAKTSMTLTAEGSFPHYDWWDSGFRFRESTTGMVRDFYYYYGWDLTNLSPNTSYTFYVKARNQEGDETPEFGPTICTTDPIPVSPYSLRAKHPDGSILKLALISVADALLLNKGTVKTRMPNGISYGAYLVETTDPNASPVRVMTPMGIKAWRKAP